MIRERSAGAVLFAQREGAPEFLILHYPAGHWDFPKGNVEEGEDEVETVRREIEEETGIKDIGIETEFKNRIEYYYRREEQLVRKEVVFYLAKTDTRSVRISSEHLGFLWLSYSQAAKKVTFRNAKQILEKANSYIKSKMEAKSPDGSLQP